MLKRLLVIGLVAAALAVAPAQAGPITGSLSFSGAAQPWGGTNWFNTTGIDFLAASATVQSSPLPTGTYLGTQDTATFFSDFTFDPFPAAGVTPLWTFTKSGITYSFDYLVLGSLSREGDDVSSSISILNGTGTLYATGFDPTPGSFSLTAQGYGALGGGESTFSFSASDVATATVPDPGSSMLLLGIGLIGVATARRRMKR
ncbi:MAG: VPDSG-CTERM sorting domain-containing protein [Cryobacterium sp.]